MYDMIYIYIYYVYYVFCWFVYLSRQRGTKPSWTKIYPFTSKPLDIKVRHLTPGHSEVNSSSLTSSRHVSTFWGPMLAG